MSAEGARFQDLWIVGAGGHAKVAAAAARAGGRRVAGVFDDDPGLRGAVRLGAPVTTPVPLTPPDGQAHAAIGDNAARRRLVEARPAWLWTSIVHPDAWVAAEAVIEAGVLVSARACVQVDAVIARHAIINSGAIVEHDGRVGAFCHVAPGAVLAGSVTLEEGAFVGIGACVSPGLTIGAWAVVGAGAVVIRDVPAGATVVGNPARLLRPPVHPKMATS